MKNVLISLLLASSLSGCALFNWGKQPEKVEVSTTAEAKTPLALSEPDPIKVKTIRWMVITKENAATQFARIEAEGSDPVFFAITDDGYKQLSITLAELRNLIATQRKIIAQYKSYYEPTVEPSPTKK
jgi:hypothetical protein